MLTLTNIYNNCSAQLVKRFEGDTVVYDIISITVLREVANPLPFTKFVAGRTDSDFVIGSAHAYRDIFEAISDVAEAWGCTLAELRIKFTGNYHEQWQAAFRLLEGKVVREFNNTLKKWEIFIPVRSVHGGFSRDYFENSFYHETNFVVLDTPATRKIANRAVAAGIATEMSFRSSNDQTQIHLSLPCRQVMIYTLYDPVNERVTLKSLVPLTVEIPISGSFEKIASFFANEHIRLAEEEDALKIVSQFSGSNGSDVLVVDKCTFLQVRHLLPHNIFLAAYRTLNLLSRPKSEEVAILVRPRLEDGQWKIRCHRNFFGVVLGTGGRTIGGVAAQMMESLPLPKLPRIQVVESENVVPTYFHEN